MAENAVSVKMTLDDADCIYGLGDKTGVLNKREYEYEMWNTDNPAPHEDNFKALYKSVPFMMVLYLSCCGRKPGLLFYDRR